MSKRRLRNWTKYFGILLKDCSSLFIHLGNPMKFQANANYGLRESVRVLQQEMGQFFDPTKIIITTCNADSNFHPRYIEALTSRFLKEEKPDAVVFQAPLLYNWGLDGTSFVTRVTWLLHSTLMMGALIPFNINTMSIFSFSLKLCISGNYVPPA